MRTLWALPTIALVAACSSADEKAPTQRETIGQSWKYEAGENGKPKLAYIGSSNSVQTMTAPDTFGVLLLQPVAGGKPDVTVKLVGAPFTCDLSDCKVSAETSDGKTHEWKGRMTDNKDGIELLPASHAYDAIRSGPMIRVNMVVGSKSETFPFQFDVAGLDLKN